jgi:hypothetical protein
MAQLPTQSDRGRSVAGVVLKGDSLQLVCHPAYGFHLSSMVERQSGTELLWCSDREPTIHDRLGAPGAASIESWEQDVFIGGWFGMFPSCGLPSVRSELSTWMHGEVGRRAWTVSALSDEPNRVEATLLMQSSPWKVKRSVVMTSRGFIMRTEAQNVGREALDSTFGEHPCFAREAFAGGRIRLAAAKSDLGIPVANPKRSIYPEGASILWPTVTDGGRQLRADVIPPEPDDRLDHLSIRLASPRIALESPSLGGELQLTVDLGQLPHVLVWERFDADGPVDVLSTEPCSAPGRTYDEAVASGAVLSTPPGASLSFSVTVDWVPIRTHAVSSR